MGDRDPIRAGSFVGRYMVVERLGAGGMGVVFAAYDAELDRKVAVKLLLRDAGGSDARGPARQRLLREAQAMARLDHPNVVAVHDAGTHEGSVFIAMEYIDGETLRSWWSPTRTWREVLAVMRAAGEGLAAAHAAGLVHRDFKPDNVMVGHDGRVRVMDFGLVGVDTEEASVERKPKVADDRVLEPGAEAEADVADRAGDRIRDRLASMGKLAQRSVGHSSTLPDAMTRTSAARGLGAQLTAEGAVIGTPAYMAPEQFAAAAVDARGDQFAFCVTLFEGLYRTRPFAGDTWLELSRNVQAGAIQPPPSDASVPSWLRRVVVRGFAPEPDDRYPDMRTLLGLLATDVSKRRRRVAVGTVLAAAVVAAGWAASGTPGDVCTGAQREIEPVWNEARRDSVRAGLQSQDVPHAADVAERTVSTFDRYAEQWVAMHEDACHAARFRREQSTEMLDRRMACLSSRRRAMDALAKVLAEAQRDTLDLAVQAAQRLPTVDRCADLDALLAAVPPPDDAQLQLEVDRIRDAILDARALEAAGRYQQGLGVLEALAVPAAYPPVAAEVGLARGRLLDGAGRSDAAAEALRSAAAVARSSGHDEVAAQAEVHMVFVAGYSQRRTEEGLWWAEHADAAVHRLGRREDLAATLDNHWGVVLHLAGQADAARRDLEAALEARERLLGDEHPDTIESLYNLGVAARAQGRYAEAKQHHETALDRREALLGRKHPKVAESLNALGAVLARAGQVREAIELFERALEIQQPALGPTHPRVAGTLINLGTALAELREDARAEAVLREAIEISAADDPRVDLAITNLANLYLLLDRDSEARPYFERVLASTERRHGPAHFKTGVALTGLGKAADGEGDRAAAISVLERAVQILDNTDAEPAMRGQAHFALAQAVAKKDRSRAVELGRRARDEYAGDAWKPQRQEVEAFLEKVR